MKIIHKPAEYGKMVKRGLFAFLRGLITLCWCNPLELFRAPYGAEKR